jgi:IMP dehydrogenase
MAEVEIGVGKTARRGYGLDEIAIVPSRRTRDAGEVDVAFRLDAFDFALPVIGSALDAVVSPASAARISALGGLGAINLEGLWTRYEDPEPLLDEIAALDPQLATSRLQAIYSAPIRPELLVERVRALGQDGMISAGALTPQRARELAPYILEAELDILFIQGTVVSAEHVAQAGEPLNLKEFIRELDIPIVVGGCSSYQTALHLMRTGAVGVLVGVGSGGTGETRGVLGIGSPQATAIADAAGARSRHLEETGVYVQVIADGGMSRGGDIAKAIACGADAVMVGSALAAASEAPGRGTIWPNSASHLRLPRGTVERVGTIGTMEEILFGPGNEPTGRLNLVGALRQSMAMSGYASVREFHKAEVVVTSSVLERDAPRSLVTGLE